MKKKIVIFGCGRLAKIVAKAVADNILPEYELVGAYSRTFAKAEHIASIVEGCKACASFEELLALKPDFLVEAASPAGMKEIAIPTLKNGTSIITLSIGALADNEFKALAAETARENGVKIYIASGATGGFDVLRTAALMGGASANFFNNKGPAALRKNPVYEPSLETEQKIVFSGTAREVINTFPTGLNVAVAASLASVGPEKMQVKMQSTPGFVGDTQRVEIRNEQVHAVVDVYSATPEIAAWSVVSTLLNIASPIEF